MQGVDGAVSRGSQNDDQQSRRNESKNVNKNFENETVAPIVKENKHFSKKKLLPTMVALYLIFFLIALVRYDRSADGTGYKN